MLSWKLFIIEVFWQQEKYEWIEKAYLKIWVQHDLKHLKKEDRPKKINWILGSLHTASATLVLLSKDTKEVFVVTTAVNPTKVEVIQRTQKNGQKKDMFCPTAIAEYTRSMGGVDHFDYYWSSYSIGRRSKKSWFRMFWFLFESAIINAYILYKLNNQNRKNIYRDFRLRLATSLKSGHISNKKQDPVVYKNKKRRCFWSSGRNKIGAKRKSFFSIVYMQTVQVL